MYRARTKPFTGKRKPGSAGETYCRANPGDPSCYFPGENDQFVNDLTGQTVDSGCIGGDRNAPGNPRDCDFRKIRFKGPNPTQLAALPGAKSHFNRARIQYADSQALVKKYSPFQLDASGWPDIPALTAQQCHAPTDALIARLNSKIIPELPGARIWVSERGPRRLKCVREMPVLRYPQGMAVRNRYFQMGVSYAHAASAHLWEGLAAVFNNNLAGAIDPDEAGAIAYLVQYNLVWGDVNPIRQWRDALKLLKLRHKKATEAALNAEIQAAAAAAAALPIDDEILNLLAGLSAEEAAALQAMLPP